MKLNTFVRKLGVVKTRLSVRLKATYLIWRVSLNKKRPTHVAPGIRVYVRVLFNNDDTPGRPYVKPTLY